ncbi:MAG: hypothetical protein AAB539_01215 [Patescibacteria group bacterium]
MTGSYFIRISVLVTTLALTLLFFVSGAVGSDGDESASEPSLAATLRARRALIAKQKEKERRAQIQERIRGNPAPDVSAEAFIVRLLDDEMPIVSRRVVKTLSPASITKLLTAVVARDNIGEGVWIPMTSDAKRVEEKRSNAQAGDSFMRDDLLTLMLVGSANDAALALAEETGRLLGGNDFNERIRLFTRLMDDKARAIGLRQSSFDNPTGLDDNPPPGCFETSQASGASSSCPMAIGHPETTAEDLGRLAAYILHQYPFIFDITQKIESAITADNGRSVRVETTNKLLTEFDRIRGGKTGFTDSAGETLLLVYTLPNGETAIIVLLRSADRFDDATQLLRWLDEVFRER